MHQRFVQTNTFTRCFRCNGSSSSTRHARRAHSCQLWSPRSGQSVVSQLVNAIELNRNISRPFFPSRCVHYINIRTFRACKWRYMADGAVCRRTGESYCVYAQDTLAPSVTFSTFHPCALFPSVPHRLPFPTTQPSQTTSETSCSKNRKPVIIMLES